MSSRSHVGTGPRASGSRSRVALAAVALGALGALALVAVPRRPPTALELEAQRRTHGLRLARAELLGALEDYRSDHGAWPGIAPEGAHDRPHAARWLREQLLRPTDARGRLRADSASDAERFPFGPYLRAIPANPLDGSATLHVVGRDDAAPSGALGAGGWLFDPRDGTLRSNAVQLEVGDA